MSEFHTATGIIHYEILGESSPDAPKITLLHNFMSTGRVAWAGVLNKLRGFQVLLPDLPGHGQSLGHPANYTYSESGEQIAALMAQEGFAKDHLAGCSAGGMIAQLLVAHKWVRPSSLTLVSTTYSTNPQTTGNKANLAVEDFVASPKWLEATARLHDPYQGDGYFYGELLPAFRAFRTSFGIDLSLDVLKTFTLPVCIIHGELDEFFPIYLVQQMQMALSQSEVHIIPEQTHALIFRKPWVVGEIMRKFLEEQKQ